MVDVDRDIARDVYRADAALIRPDQIVAWRGSVACDAPQVVATVTGRGATCASGNLRALAKVN